MSFGTEPIEIIYLEMIKNIVRIYILRRKNKWMQLIEYSCAITPQVRQAGNRLSGLTETAYASLLA